LNIIVLGIYRLATGYVNAFILWY